MRKCFQSNEFSIISLICKTCPDNMGCRKDKTKKECEKCGNEYEDDECDECPYCEK